MRSDTIKKGVERAPHRSLLKATGVRDEDFDKPFIAICNSFVEIIPGHVHLDVVGCRYCQANLADLENQQAEHDTASQTRRRRYFQSSAGYLKQPE